MKILLHLRRAFRREPIETGIVLGFTIVCVGYLAWVAWTRASFHVDVAGRVTTWP